MKTVIALALLGLVLTQAYFFVLKYRTETGTPWVRFWSTVQYSGTVLWQHIVAIVSAMFGMATYLLDAFNMPEVKDWLIQRFDAETVAGIFALVAVVTIFVRLRGFDVDQARADTIAEDTTRTGAAT